MKTAQGFILLAFVGFVAAEQFLTLEDLLPKSKEEWLEIWDKILNNKGTDEKSVKQVSDWLLILSESVEVFDHTSPITRKLYDMFFLDQDSFSYGTKYATVISKIMKEFSDSETLSHLLKTKRTEMVNSCAKRLVVLTEVYHSDERDNLFEKIKPLINHAKLAKGERLPLEAARNYMQSGKKSHQVHEACRRLMDISGERISIKYLGARAMACETNPSCQEELNLWSPLWNACETLIGLDPAK